MQDRSTYKREWGVNGTKIWCGVRLLSQYPGTKLFFDNELGFSFSDDNLLQKVKDIQASGL